MDKQLNINFKITQEKFCDLVSIEEWLNFHRQSPTEMYEIMLNFVADENGNEVDVEQARKMFKKVRRGQWNECLAKFAQSVRDAFVSPTNGGS